MHLNIRILIFLSLILSCCLLVPSLGTAQRSKTSSSYTILVSKHKKAPEQSSSAVSDNQSSRGKRSSHVTASYSKRKPQTIPFDISVTELRKKLSSRSAMILDVSSGNTIYAHSPHRSGQPASTIKVLTGLIAIKYLKDEDRVAVSRRASHMPSSKIYLQAGKTYIADDLINAVLLSSANDASVALAERIAGSEKTFAKLMTHKAKAFGAESTVCKTATGLTARGQKSTVRDLVTIFEKAMRNQEFSDRIAQEKTKTRFGKVLRNHNKALWSIDGAEGGKTGYTRAARQTYVGKFSRDGKEIVVAIMGSETMWNDIANLVEYGFAQIATDKNSSESSEKLASRFSPINESTLNQQHALLILSESKKLSAL